MKKILFFILLANFMFAQNLDSLYNTIISVHSTDNSNPKTNNITKDLHYQKCDFSLIADIKLHFNKFTSEQQNTIQKILERPTRQKSIVSPAGLFRIHYNITGSNAPDYFNGINNTIQLSVDSLAIAFDSSYNYEVNRLGYTPPPSDGTDGGDDLYDIYISKLSGGLYGETVWEPIGNGNSKSYIVIDNKMNFESSEGINAARVTAAHEFHHAIQTGTYSTNTNGNSYYFELTSTSMEEFVYDDVNDYYGYLYTYFNAPDKRFTLFSGYDLAIWNIFLKEKFERLENNSKKGFEIIKRTWELMRDEQISALQSIKKALAENGLSFKSTFAEFAQWTYFTNHRAKPGSYFSEASEYPLIVPFAKYDYTPPKKKYELNIAPMSNVFIEFDVSHSHDNNKLVTIITNCDIVSADISEHPPYINCSYSLSTEDGDKKIVNKYFTTLKSDGIQYLNESIILDNLIVYGNAVTQRNIAYAYPQPFNRAKHNYLFLPTTLSKNGVAKLIIYNVNMDLVYNAELPIPEYGEKITVRWDGRDNTGTNVASGIYIFVTDSDGIIKQGKIAIINN